MEFWINVRVSYDKRGRYLVEHRPVSEREEHFIIKGRNGQLVFSSNRPLFRNKGLKHRKPDYQLIRGKMNNRSFLDHVIEAIQNFMEPPPGKKNTLLDPDSMPPFLQKGQRKGPAWKRKDDNYNWAEEQLKQRAKERGEGME